LIVCGDAPSAPLSCASQRASASPWAGGIMD